MLNSSVSVVLDSRTGDDDLLAGRSDPAVESADLGNQLDR
jgi:hypothetical protein